MIDTETLSRRPSAAIIQIAAVPFNMDGSCAKTKNGEVLPTFDEYVDATTCAMYGMDFDMETVEWWAKNFPANNGFKYKLYKEPLAIQAALDKFVAALSDLLQISGADELKVWCQGTDFDIALLREAFRIVKGSDKDIPWKYRNVRDARTYFLEAAALFAPNDPDPYSLITIDGVKHDALADCEWSIKAVQWAYEKYNKKADAPSADEGENSMEKRIKPAIADGVYFVEDGCMPVRFTDTVCVQSPKYCNVMVSYHGHKWIVAKEDIGDGQLPLLSKDAHPEDTSSLYMCEIDALNEFDMYSCTEHLRKAGLAFELDADLYIPTAGQLAAMFLFRKELNKALEMVGGTPMKEDVYWSSSESNAWVSWVVGFDSGLVDLWGNKCSGGYVRPCTAFEL